MFNSELLWVLLGDLSVQLGLLWVVLGVLNSHMSSIRRSECLTLTWVLSGGQGVQLIAHMGSIRRSECFKSECSTWGSCGFYQECLTLT